MLLLKSKEPMIKIVRPIAYVFILCLWSCTTKRAENRAEKKYTQIKILEKKYDFGIADQYDTITHRYKLVNTGETDFIINNVKSDCDCTTIDWERNSIKHGDTTYVDVRFIAKDTGGMLRVIALNSNVEEVFSTLYLQGKVIPKKRD